MILYKELPEGNIEWNGKEYYPLAREEKIIKGDIYIDEDEDINFSGNWNGDLRGKQDDFQYFRPTPSLNYLRQYEEELSFEIPI